MTVSLLSYEVRRTANTVPSICMNCTVKVPRNMQRNLIDLILI